MSGANANHSNHHMEFLPEGIQIDISASDNNKELKYSIMLLYLHWIKNSKHRWCNACKINH